MADAFAIYYENATKDVDRSFPRAAATWADEFRSGNGYKLCHVNPRTYLEPARSEADFVTAWSRIAERAKNEGLKFVEGHVFSHASISWGGDGSLEFTGGEGTDGTLTKAEIKALPVLPWAENAVLVLHGCRSGLQGVLGRPAAWEFAEGQKVHTVGMAGYAYFSRVRNQYSVISASSSPTYLWAYARARNGPFGGGQAMGALDFYP